MIGRFFRRWRKPAPPPPADHRNMNEDWAPGDLAECIVKGPWTPSDPFDPKAGDVLRVVRIREGYSPHFNRIVYTLSFEGKPAGYAWETVGFRKLRPVQEPAEASWSAWLKNTLRVPEPAE
ncbi:hypothetical protein F1640_18430 [Novosphingobium sp. NBM11]|uniref:hypothetical protein n=1 Tax=Novosphingobium sp. NBM11 TaxID=2596914 RepID=UPI001892563C|nr:hypothetical protein [Novosphingobium sp. NBM11]MBF5091933.1 hypothetical protein [Novosphingobium sp. NBM11]